ncbi:MAG TPA: spermidine synthase [Burkholderiales bacterium]
MHRWHASSGDLLELSEKDGVRFLHLGGEQIQSAMRLAAPDELELAYVRAMMGFLLFLPEASRVTMVGLGGGSLAKFIHARLPEVSAVAVEILPEVVAAARCFFHLPPDDIRLQVVVAEGGEYVAAHPGSCDALLVDGFADGAHPGSLTGAAFYEAAREALDQRGVLAVNFIEKTRGFEPALARMEAAFGGHVVLLPAEQAGNTIAFGLKGLPARLRWEELRARAEFLESRLGLPCTRFLPALRRFNPSSERGLDV